MIVLKIYIKVNGYRFLNKLIQLYTIIFLMIVSSVVRAEEFVELSKPMASSQIASVSIGLLLVLILFFGLVFLFKKLPSIQGARTGAVKILDTMYLGANEKILLIQVGVQQILIGVNSQKIETLHVLNEPIIIPSDSNPPLFKDRLAQFISDKVIKGSHKS